MWNFLHKLFRIHPVRAVFLISIIFIHSLLFAENIQQKHSDSAQTTSLACSQEFAELEKDLSQRAFQFFKDKQDSETGFIFDRTQPIDPSQKEWLSSAGTGFYLAGLPHAIQNNLITQEEALNRIEKIFNTIEKLQKKHQALGKGFIPRFFYNDLENSNIYEYSTLDMSLLIQGLMSLKGYLENCPSGKNSEQMTKLNTQAASILKNIDWSQHFIKTESGDTQLTMGRGIRLKADRAKGEDLKIEDAAENKELYPITFYSFEFIMPFLAGAYQPETQKDFSLAISHLNIENQSLRYHDREISGHNIEKPLFISQYGGFYLAPFVYEEGKKKGLVHPTLPNLHHSAEKALEAQLLFAEDQASQSDSTHNRTYALSNGGFFGVSAGDAPWDEEWLQQVIETAKKEKITFDSTATLHNQAREVAKKYLEKYPDAQNPVYKNISFHFLKALANGNDDYKAYSIDQNLKKQRDVPDGIAWPHLALGSLPWDKDNKLKTRACLWKESPYWNEILGPYGIHPFRLGTNQNGETIVDWKSRDMIAIDLGAQFLATANADYIAKAANVDEKTACENIGAPFYWFQKSSEGSQSINNLGFKFAEDFNFLTNQ